MNDLIARVDAVHKELIAILGSIEEGKMPIAYQQLYKSCGYAYLATFNIRTEVEANRPKSTETR